MVNCDLNDIKNRVNEINRETWDEMANSYADYIEEQLNGCYQKIKDWKEKNYNRLLQEECKEDRSLDDTDLDNVNTVADSDLDKNDSEMVDHPQHYGGKDNPYEAIKVIEAWDLNFNLGNCVKYIARAGLKPDGTLDKEHKQLEDLEKVAWYANREVERFKKEAGLN